MIRAQTFIAASAMLILAPTAIAMNDGEAKLRELLAMASSAKSTHGTQEQFSGDCGSSWKVGSSRELAQYIHNETYVWAVVDASDGLCVEMISPVQRALTQNEARLFMAMHENGVPISAITAKRLSTETLRPRPTSALHSGFELNADTLPATADQSKTLYQNNASFRINFSTTRKAPATMYPSMGQPFTEAVTMLQNGDNAMGIATGSAVQVSPYVYVTAAHNVVNRANGVKYPGLALFPGHGTAQSYGGGIKAAASVVATGYVGSTETGSLSTDLAFIRVDQPRYLSKYPPIHAIYTTADVRAGYPGLGNTLQDPFAVTPSTQTFCYDSFNRTYSDSVNTSADFNYLSPTKYCLESGDNPQNWPILGNTIKTGAATFGYPDWVGTVNNTVAHSLYAGPSLMTSNQTGQALMYYTGANPVIGFKADVSPGNSGGPVFGYFHYSERSKGITLLGIVTNKLNSGPTSPFALAAGMFNYNQSFWQSNIGWTPDYRFLITSPYVFVPVWQASNYRARYSVGVNAPGVDAVAVYRTANGYPPEFVGNYPNGSWINYSGGINSVHTYKMYGLYDTIRSSPLAQGTVSIMYDPRRVPRPDS